MYIWFGTIDKDGSLNPTWSVPNTLFKDEKNILDIVSDIGQTMDIIVEGSVKSKVNKTLNIHFNGEIIPFNASFYFGPDNIAVLLFYRTIGTKTISLDTLNDIYFYMNKAIHNAISLDQYEFGDNDILNQIQKINIDYIKDQRNYIKVSEQERRNLEMEVELSKREAEMKSDFFSKVSHDMRNPLNGIIGMNQMAIESLPEDCSVINQYLLDINTSSQHLLTLINDVLDMSKIESGEMKINNEEFSVIKLMESANVLIKNQADMKKLPFKIEFPKDIDYFHIGDETRIKQILINLNSNAIKFTDKGYVLLKLEIDRLDENRDLFNFTVKDTGIGMSQDFLENMFSPFSQESGSTYATYGGTGLGLSIVKSFVDLMNGEIKVYSEKDIGTVFTLEIPMERSSKKIDLSKEKKKDTIEFAKYTGVHVLLCEDVEINVKIVEFMLGKYDITVDVAENGEIGLNIFKESKINKYDLVFMDIQMPIMNGYETTEAIRKLDREDNNIPIIALTGSTFEEERIRAFDSGMNEQITKPLNTESLDYILKSFLE